MAVLGFGELILVIKSDSSSVFKDRGAMFILQLLFINVFDYVVQCFAPLFSYDY